MKRRTILMGAGSAIAGAGGLVGSAAFSTSATFGTVSVTVENRNIKVYNSYNEAQGGGGNTVDSLSVDGNARKGRVNVDPDLAGIYNAGNKSYDIDVKFVDDEGSPVEIPDYTDGIDDFRLFFTGEGNASAEYLVNTSDSRNTTSLPSPGFLDQNSTNRTYVPDAGIEPDSYNGPYTISDATGNAVGVAALITIKNNVVQEDLTLPDLLLTVE